MLLMNKCLGTVARMGGVHSVLEDFLNSFIDMTRWNSEYVLESGWYIHYPRPPRVSVHDVARNLAVESMRGNWLLQLDSDHSFEPDILGRILRLHEMTGVEVITGIYQYKNPPYSPVLYRYDEESGLQSLANWDRNIRALRVDSAGAGCLWVTRQVYDRVREELGEKPFERIQGYGEDHSFFLRLKKLHIPAICATTVECHHLQVRALGLDDYDLDDVEASEPLEEIGYGA